MPRRDVAPVLSAHKWALGRCRLLECALGGPRVVTVVDEESIGLVAPQFLLLQVWLWATPVAMLVASRVLLDGRPPYVSAVASGLLSAALVVGVRLSIYYFGWKTPGSTAPQKESSRDTLAQRPAARKAFLAPLTAQMSTPQQSARGFLDIEFAAGPAHGSFADSFRESVQFSCSRPTLGWRGIGAMLGRAAVAALTSFVFVLSLSRSEDQRPTVRALSWLTLGMALYCVGVRDPVEIAQWHPNRRPADASARSLHVVLGCAAGGMRVHLGVALLPVLWALGLLPGAEALLEWILESLNLHVLGGTAASSSRRQALHFFRGATAAGLAFVALHAGGNLGFVGVAGLGASLSLGLLLPATASVSARTLCTLGELALMTASGALGARMPGAEAALALGIAGVLWGAQTVFWLAFRRGEASCVYAVLRVIFRAATVFWTAANLSALRQLQSLSSGQLVVVAALSMRCVRVAVTSPWIASAELCCGLGAGLFAEQRADVGLATAISVRMALGGWLIAVGREAFGNLWFVSVHVWTALRNPKLRLPRRARVLCLLAAPLWNPAMAILAAILGSPVIPVAGTGVFVAGFPRPRRLWPSYLASKAPGTEAVYYEQVMPHLLKALRATRVVERHATRFGTCIFVVRFEKMIAWVQVLEHEAGYSIIHVKGLELQEPTSCHNVEADRLDRLIGNGNLFASAAVRPICKLTVPTYSHSQISLTGVLGNGEMARILHRAFGYVLVWAAHRDKGALRHLAALEVKASERPGLDQEQHRAAIWRWFKYLRTGTAGTSRPGGALGPAGPAGPLGDDFDIDALLDELDDFELSSDEGETDGSEQALHDFRAYFAGVTRDRITSRHEENEGSMSNPRDRIVSCRKETACATTRGNLTWDARNAEKTDAPLLSAREGEHLADVAQEKGVSRHEENEILVPSQSKVCATRGKTTWDARNAAKTEAPLSRAPTKPRAVTALKYAVPPQAYSPEPARGGKDLSSPQDCSSDLAVSRPPRQVADPHLDVSLPMAKGALQKARDFASVEGLGSSCEPSAVVSPWAAAAQSTVPRSVSGSKVVPGSAARAADPKTAEKVFRDEDLVEAVLHAQGSFGGEARLQSAKFVVERFEGNSGVEGAEARQRVLEPAFRTAVKLALDAFVLGDPDPSLHDLKACAEALDEYASNWHIGVQEDQDWARALRAERGHLLALSQREGSGFGALQLVQLSLQSETATVCALEPCMVRGLWGALALELLFFTNDDDERYSIQAHPVFLRNMAVQSAEPPLGYPVFCSGPTRV